ncbi:MAG: hypothetical protein N2595_07685 [bacterium]|nr:hypothetical protein [bacterium]
MWDGVVAGGLFLWGSVEAEWIGASAAGVQALSFGLTAVLRAWGVRMPMQGVMRLLLGYRARGRWQ